MPTIPVDDCAEMVAILRQLSPENRIFAMGALSALKAKQDMEE